MFYGIVKAVLRLLCMVSLYGADLRSQNKPDGIYFVCCLVELKCSVGLSGEVKTRFCSRGTLNEQLIQFLCLSRDPWGSNVYLLSNIY